MSARNALVVLVGVFDLCSLVICNYAFAEEATSNSSKTFFESALGVQIAWYATLVSLVVGIIPLLLYFQERKKSQLLDSVLKRYDLAQHVERDAREAFTSKTTADQALSQSKQELAALTRQLEESIPNQARAAFFVAAIPEVDRQILYLQEQRKAMERGLTETGVPLDDSSRLKPVLQAEINQTVMARRKLDEKQTILSIITGLAAGSVAFTAFYQVQFVLRIVLGIAILWAVGSLCYQWSIVYTENRVSRVMRRHWSILILLIFGVPIAGFLVFVFILITLDRW